MSKYPVPIFQPTVPLDGNIPLDWLEKINHWMSLQYDKNEAFRRQLETQNHLLVQMNRRLDRVFLKLATLDSEIQPIDLNQSGMELNPAVLSECNSSCQFASGAGSQSEEERAASNFSPTEAEAVAPKTAVSSWQRQREEMLKCLVAQLEIEDSLYPGEPRIEQSPNEIETIDSISLADFPTQGLTPEVQLQQIEALKEQLHAAIREMEVECSVQRAKLSHERARLEAREVDLERREKKLARDNREKKVQEERAEPLVSRIKGLLKRGG
ncbi:MAG: hypothetical protein ACKO0N_16565 [Planctomycetota bacterium]